MGKRPRWTYNNQIWHEGSCRRCNHPCQILSKSVKGFPSCGGPKMGVFHWLWQSPLQQVSTTVLPVMVFEIRHCYWVRVLIKYTSSDCSRKILPRYWPSDTQKTKLIAELFTKREGNENKNGINMETEKYWETYLQSAKITGISLT